MLHLRQVISFSRSMATRVSVLGPIGPDFRFFETMADMTAKMMETLDGAGQRKIALKMRAIAPDDWDKTAHLFDNVCQEQMHVFAAERWPSMHIDCLHFFDGEELVAGCLIMHRAAPMGLGGLAVCKWGPMVRDASREDAEDIHAAVVDKLMQIYAVEKRLMLSILPRPRPREVNFAVEQLKERGFQQGSGLPYPSRYFVNVDIDDDAMRASFNQKWRSHLKKSEKNDLEFEHCDASNMSEFYRLYEEMTARKQFPDYSAYDSLHHLMDNIDKSARPELFIVREGGEAVAGGVIFTAGDTAVYLYGATNDRALPLRAGYFMHWHIMRWLSQQERIKWYDLGGTDGFLGLHQFKNGMVGKAGVVSTVPHVHNYAHWFIPRALGNLAFFVRDVKANTMRKLNELRSKSGNQDG